MTEERGNQEEINGNNEEQPVTESEPVRLSEAEVEAALGEARLPEAAVERLRAAPHADADALKAAIAAERSYISTLTGGGKPFGGTDPQQEPQQTGEGYQAKMDAGWARVCEKYGVAS